MDPIALVDGDLPRSIGLPSVETARPRTCSACGAIADGGRQVLHGHGVRRRLVAVPPRRWIGAARLLEVPARRFRCTRCGTTCTVLPRGVLPRHLYSLFAIVFAWWLAVSPPLGVGLGDDAVYARQGVDRLTVGAETHRTGRRRWRSLARWAAKLGYGWPTRAVAGSTWRARVASLLASFVAEAGEVTAAAVISCAVRGHVGSGVAM